MYRKKNVHRELKYVIFKFLRHLNRVRIENRVILEVKTYLSKFRSFNQVSKILLDHIQNFAVRYISGKEKKV